MMWLSDGEDCVISTGLI